MHISKFAGFVISIPFIAAYCGLFYAYNLYKFGLTPTLDWWSLRIVIAGSILHMMAYLENGGQLTFLTKRIDCFWGDGVCFIPNFLHATITAFHWALVWGVKTDDRDFEDQNRVDVLLDPLFPHTLQHVQMSAAGAAAARFFNGMLFWFVGYKKSQKHLWMSRFGFRVILVGYVMATFAGLSHHATNYVSQAANEATSAVKPFAENPTPSTVAPIPQKRESVTPSDTISGRNAVVNLAVGPQPADLQAETFIPNGERVGKGESEHVCRRLKSDSRNYCLYNEFGLNYIDTFTAKERSCLAIPKGKQARFKTSTMPTNAINMEDEVEFTPEWWAPWSEGKTTWKDLRGRWWEVNTKYPITTYAIAGWKFPKDEDGAIVCF